jgi:hypothetical protein
MRCLGCDKTIRLNGQRLAFTWRTWQICPACFNQLSEGYYSNAIKARLEVRGQ